MVDMSYQAHQVLSLFYTYRGFTLLLHSDRQKVS